MSLLEKLVNLLDDGKVDPDLYLTDDTPLISSGQIDSLALFNLPLWIEKEMNAKLDLTTLDPLKEWDTITDILVFIEKKRC
jgi:acyl carrier protein